MARWAVTVLLELALVFCGRIFTRLRPPPSARFSRINHRSRNQSPPCLVVDGRARRFRQGTTIHLSTPRRQLGFPAAGGIEIQPAMQLVGRAVAETRLGAPGVAALLRLSAAVQK